MEDQLAIIIEAGIGLAGFAGVTVALAGCPDRWNTAERLRVGSMLFWVFLSIFSAYTYFLLSNNFPSNLALRICSCVLAILLFSQVSLYWLKASPLHRQNDPTLNRPLTILLISLSVVICILLAINTLGEITDRFPIFFGGLIWLQLMGAIMFMRILFIRPGGSRTEYTDRKN